MEVYDILKLVADTSSKNEKEDILIKHKDNKDLKECFRLAYSPTINFYMKQIPSGWEHIERRDTNWCSVFTTLEGLSSRTFTGNEAKTYIKDSLSVMDCGVAEIVCRILQGDLRCGVGVATINKVWKNLIVKPPRKGASSMSEKALAKIKYPAALEQKADGAYAASVCGESTEIMSRNGNPIDFPILQNHLSCGAFDGFALEGELVTDLSRATREVGNGIIGQIIKGTATYEDMDKIIYLVWDCIDVNSYKPKGVYNVSNKERRKLLEGMIEDYSKHFNGIIVPKIVLIDRHIVNSFEEATELFEGYVRSGFEGGVLKSLNTPWKDIAKPSDVVKLKRKDPADLEVVGCYEGTGKAAGMLGGLSLESSEGIIKTNCGSGFSDEQRIYYWNNKNEILGKIVEVKYDSVTQDKKTLQKSLFLPIFKQVRDDKLEADSLEEIEAKVRVKTTI